MGPDCSAPVGGATPVGVVMTMLEAPSFRGHSTAASLLCQFSNFQVHNVTNFDGHFEGKGVPSMEAGGCSARMGLLYAVHAESRSRGMDDLAKMLKVPWKSDKA